MIPNWGETVGRKHTLKRQFIFFNWGGGVQVGRGKLIPKVSPDLGFWKANGILSGFFGVKHISHLSHVVLYTFVLWSLSSSAAL